MTEVTVAEAKAKLAEILKRVEAGEQVTITRRGRPVAVVQAPRQPLKSRDELRAQQVPTKRSSAELLRRMRDETY